MIINSNSSNTYYVNRNQSVLAFMKQLQKYPVLTIDQELDLVNRYQQNNDMHAKTMLINCNQRFIFSAAKRFSTNADTLMDLVCEGKYGLIVALDRYDPTRGMRLMTFAKEYIRKYMIDYYVKNKLIQRSSDEKLANKLSRERSEFFNKNGRYPLNSEMKEIISEKYGLDIKDDSMINDIDYTYIDDTPELSGEDPEGFGTYKEFRVATASENDAVDELKKEDMKSVVLAAISQVCRPKEADIIKMIYGIGMDREYSISEISAKYGVCETRINQIKSDVEKRLRNNMQLSYLVGA